MPLEQELRYFESRRAELLTQHKGQIALVKGEELIGTYSTTREAFTQGVRLFGNQPFLLKAIEERDQIASIPALAVGAISADT